MKKGVQQGATLTIPSFNARHVKTCHTTSSGFGTKIFSENILTYAIVEV
jgi:hypothetical protein